MKTATLLVSALALAFTFGVATAKTPTKVRSTQSIECSKQADVKGLHGKERKAFRAKCKKDMASSKTPKSKTASKKAA